LEAVADAEGSGVAGGDRLALTLFAPLEPGVAFCTFCPDGTEVSAAAAGAGAGVDKAAPTLLAPEEPGVAFCTLC
jgi:hypothetical protein